MEGRSRGFVRVWVEDARAGTGPVGSGMAARPALMPIEVWTHRKKGEEWRTILNLRFLMGGPPPAALAASSCASLSLKISPMRWPVARAWFHPEYVSGGS